MDLFRHLPRSNCRECGLPTCMAFAALAIKGERPVGDCPHVDPAEVSHLVASPDQGGGPLEAERQELLRSLIEDVRGVDFPSVAERIGAFMNGDRIAVRVLGRIFELDPAGGLHSLSHINPWVHLPVLRYVAVGAGEPLAGELVRFADLEGARDWAHYFSHRCEGALRTIADRDPELFGDVLGLFSESDLREGSPVIATADQVFTLRPLPRVLIKVAYWREEGEFEPNLVLLFDRSDEKNLGVEGVYWLTTGIIEMVRRIVSRHRAD